ncbi:uncharacterized protein AB675_4668 [Cyphellophora attinorum]|uniref:Dolichyl-diphosphooligosaccharide--protein glycosyltransferase subunit 4 n=1 Tax=Cyphellophora attinorum TaxID=1664694 RepID=A0A0N1HNF4_9EURO|nr:uncharacterized protein AB675_4668 [Phialophora attinorum]KPI39027.1 hypothetical protein AB675_4668 [Phialophora attinorum]
MSIRPERESLANTTIISSEALVSLDPSPEPCNQKSKSPHHYKDHTDTHTAAMISDSQLYTLALFLGSASMLMIVLYHFLEVNAVDEDDTAVGVKSGGVAVGREGEKL